MVPLSLFVDVAETLRIGYYFEEKIQTSVQGGRFIEKIYYGIRCRNDQQPVHFI